jgi:predicted ATPase/class 3 adenylate cyclase
MGAMPSGTVTLLFTDIEGSTRAWDAHPTEMREALQRHDDLVRDAVVRHGGYVFKTVGDAFCVAFQDASCAVAGAVDAQRSISREPWPDALQVRVRMALHSGSCDERDGDYFGPTVNRVARLLSLAHGGQALASSATATLADGSLPDDIALRDLGAHALKDIGGSERVSQILAADLETEFPPLRSVAGAGPRHNLPAYATTFLGRRGDLAELDSLLHKARIVTLTGPGGVGKTRLAVELAASQVNARSDGAWLVELAAIVDPADVDSAIASVLRIPEQAGVPPRTAVIQALRAQDCLLVLDNCEHVIEATAVAAEALVRACPRATVLATSREPLGIAGEYVHRVMPLEVPAADQHPEEISAHDSVRLFVDRVRLHDPAFELSGSISGPVARVCRRLDGIPLALELAAARTRALTIDEVEARLDERFRLLSAGRRTADERQRALQATIDWSFDLLTPLERTLFVRLSVFAGGCDVHSVEAVCAHGELERSDTWELLASLADKSMVQVENAGDRSYYRLLESIREYARDRLDEEAGDVAARLRRAHMEYYLGIAEETAPLWRGLHARQALERLTVDRENLRAALATSLEQGLIDAGLRLGIALAAFWRVRGGAEGADWLGALLDQQGSGGGALLRGRAACELGDLLLKLGRYDEARSRLEGALAVAREEQDDELLVRTLTFLTFLEYLAGDADASLAWSREAITAARRSGDPELLALALARQADAYDAAGKIERTRELLEEALAIARGSSNQRLLCALLNNSAEAALHFRDLDAALERLEEAVSIGEAREDVDLLMYAKRNLGTVLVAHGDVGAAKPVLRDAILLAERTGGPVPFAYAVMGCAFAASSVGDHERAAALHGAADAVFAEIGGSPEPLETKMRAEDVERIRSRMGDDAFDAASRRGAGLSRDDVVALAVERVARTAFSASTTSQTSLSSGSVS